MRRVETRSPARISNNFEQFTGADIRGWLARHAERLQLSWLLAHADDGVIWGRFDDGSLVTPEGAAACPPLRPSTLQQARAFGDSAEILIWKTGIGGWRSRLVENSVGDVESDFKLSIDEHYILWGTHAESLPNDFTLMSEGEGPTAHGLRHALPIRLQGSKSGRPSALHVRHYMTENSGGFVDIACSRLVGFRETK